LKFGIHLLNAEMNGMNGRRRSNSDGGQVWRLEGWAKAERNPWEGIAWQIGSQTWMWSWNADGDGECLRGSGVLGVRLEAEVGRWLSGRWSITQNTIITRIRVNNCEFDSSYKDKHAPLYRKTIVLSNTAFDDMINAKPRKMLINEVNNVVDVYFWR
jgi:hypothetical protein